MKNKSKIMMMCTLLLILCLTGCGLLRSDTDRLKGLLEDKYGEKFGVESYYYAGDMWAMCYPESDPTLLFQVRTDGNVTKISHDYYLQNVVARQVEEEYGPLVQQAFPGSYLSVDISNTLASAPESLPKADIVAIDDIKQYFELNNLSSYITLNIFVDGEKISNENIENEYYLIQNEIGTRIANGKLPNTIVDIFICNATQIVECKEVISCVTWRNDDIYKIIKDYPEFWIYYDVDGNPLDSPEDMDGEIYTIEKYIMERTEALSYE